MRILILNFKDPKDPAAGGAEQYATRLAEIWAADGNSVTYFTSKFKQCQPNEIIDGVEFRRFGTKFTVHDHAARYLRRFGDNFDFVVEHVSHRPFNAYKCVGNRAVAIVHHLYESQWVSEFGFPFGLIGAKVINPYFVNQLRGASIIANSLSTAQHLKSLGLRVLDIVEPGHNAPILLDKREPPTEINLLFVGRLVRYKRPDLAIEAFALVRERFPDATLDIVGSGYLMESLKKYSLPGLRIRGYVSDSEKFVLMRSSSVLLVTSKHEGWGIIATEAAASGLPVVAVDVPGLRDAVSHEITGLLAGESPQEIANATIRILEDYDYWQRLSSSGPNVASGLTWERSAAKVLSFAVHR